MSKDKRSKDTLEKKVEVFHAYANAEWDWLHEPEERTEPSVTIELLGSHNRASRRFTLEEVDAIIVILEAQKVEAIKADREAKKLAKKNKKAAKW